MATKKETEDETTPAETPEQPTEAPAFTFRPVNKAVEPEEPEETK